MRRAGHAQTLAWLGRRGLSPHLARALDAEADFRRLILARDLIARRGAGEAALRAYRELVEADIFRGLVDSMFEQLLGFELGELGGDQSQDDCLVFGHQAQRLESDGAGSVVFETVVIDVDLVEQRVGNQVVAALGAPMALIVAAADVHREVQPGRASGERGVHDLGIGLEQELAAVVAPALEVRPARGIAQRSEGCFVDLHVTASGFVKSRELLAKSVDYVGPEKIEVGVGLAADIFASGAQMKDGGRRNGHLWRARSERTEKLGFAGVYRRLPFEPRVHFRNYQRQPVPLAVDEGPLLARSVVRGRDAAQPAIEAHIKDRAAVFAVGYRLETEAFLATAHAANRVVLERAELHGGDFLGLVIGTCAQQLRRPEEAADGVGAK